MKDKSLSPELDSIELHPDAWERTERAIRGAVTSRAPTPPAVPEKKPKQSVVAVKRKR
jgi:hypothetical protein